MDYLLIIILVVVVQNQISEINKTLDNKLQQQFGQSAQIIKDVTEKLTRLDETNKQVVNFADQLRKLQDILKNPKQRGVFGEYQLEMLLQNAFQPQQYQMQYKFKDGEVVDAVLFLGEKILPIDSKFSLENYNRIVEENDSARREKLETAFKNDLKRRIDETAKYIRPEEGTMEFAFMFIPAEGIFYDLLVNKVGAIKVNTRDLIDYAINERKVHIVSPTTFYVTLQSLWQGMRAFQIQEQTKDILKNVGKLDSHIKAYEDYLQKLGTHLGTTVSMYNSAYKEFKKIDKDVVRLAGGESKVGPMKLEKPKQDE
jgi:DNA recombination protein RmuC